MNTRHELLKQMTPEMFAHLGENDVVYIKPIQRHGIDGFAVHSANGQELAIFDSWEAALTTALQHNMQPAGLH